MPRPGVEVEVVDEITPGSAILDTGQGFFIGETERGPLSGRANSLADYMKKWGNSRMAAPLMYDGVSSFFEEAGSSASAIISRLEADTAVEASEALGTTFNIEASSSGTWGNNIDVTSKEPSSGSTGAAGQPIYLSVTYNDVEVERSPTLYDVNDGINWAEKSNYIRMTPGASSALPVKDTTIALTGGTNVAFAVSDVKPALDRFTYDQGPGQVIAPGLTDPLVHEAIGIHCEENHRVALVDLPDSDDKLELHAAREELNDKIGSRLMLACGSWYSYPTESPPSDKIIPMASIEAGIISRVTRNGDVAAVAAGANGVSRRALGLAHIYSEEDRTELNANGVTLGRQMLGLVRTYGYRTAAGPDYNNNWTFFQESRVVMAIAHECNAAVEDFVFDTIDGLGSLFVHTKNVLAGICNRYYLSGALFGATPEQAFRIVCDSSTNPIESIAEGEVHAAIYVRTSKVAEWIKIEVSKVSIEREVAA